MKRITTVLATAATIGGIVFTTHLVSTHRFYKENVGYTAFVNPLIGTDYTGNTYPGAQTPFGMVQLSPDNGLPGWDRIAGYFYPDSTIAGFSHTHLSGTGAGDLYDISFMPVTLPPTEAEQPLGIHSGFTHRNEQARPGYYQVWLSDYNINVELTSTDRCGIQRYTFPEAESAIYLNLKKAMNWDRTIDTHIEIVDSVTIRGYRISDGWAPNQRVFFCTRFSKPFANVDIKQTYIADTTNHSEGKACIARFDYKTSKNEQITLTTALSAVSMEGAQANLMAEAPDDNFDKYRMLAQRKWCDELGKIRIRTTNNDDKVKFYTALYHAMLAPTIFADADGAYLGPDNRIHSADYWTNYSTFSLWDTYRAEHPLLTYTDPERVNDMVKSLIAFYQQHGRLPVWNLYGRETNMMIGYHAVAVIADAYLKDIGDFDARLALEACVSTADDDRYRGIGYYKTLGYVPYNIDDPYNSDNWSLSKTLEYAYDDYCIARMAEKMGEHAIAERFDRRAKNYRNLYNPATGFMQPRDDKGTFITPFDPEEYTPHITESNAWQYLWSVQHDIPGLIELCGGTERFEQKLDSMFTLGPTNHSLLPIFSTGMIGQYAQGNEPAHHVIYLYNAVRQPWKTQKYAAQVMRELYRNTPDGLCGNEDCGQMSAWFVFSALGFYPVDPVSGRYEIGTPLFSEATVYLSNRKTLTIYAPKASAKNIYIRGVKINGKPLQKSYITHQQIMSGATLEFDMTDKPCPAWY